MVGSNFRLPTAEELFANDPNDERGNPTLRPERSISANGSLGGKLALGEALLDWRLTGFYREIKDLIDLDDFDAATNQDIFGNVAGKVITRSLEADLQAPITDALSGNVDFTYAASGNPIEPAIQPHPRKSFQIWSRLSPERSPFSTSLSLQNVGNLHDTLGGGVGLISYGDYTVLNMGARIFLDEARQHRIGVNLANVADENYTSHLVLQRPCHW